MIYDDIGNFIHWTVPRSTKADIVLVYRNVELIFHNFRPFLANYFICFTLNRPRSITYRADVIFYDKSQIIFTDRDLGKPK